MINWEVKHSTAGQIMEEKILVLQDNIVVGSALKQVESSGWVGLVLVDSAGKILGACRLNTLKIFNPEMILAEALKFVEFQILYKNTLLEEILSYWRKTPEAIIVVTDLDNKPVGIIETKELLGQLMERFQLCSTFIQAIADTVDDAITIIDKDGTVLGWNQRAEELYHIPANEIIGQNIEAFFHCEDLMLTRVMHNGLKVRNTYHQPREGTHILINSNPIVINDRVVGSMSADRDITELVCLYHELCYFNSPVRMIEEDTFHEKKAPFRRILGHSRQLKNAIFLSQKVSLTDAPVLIRGETGTGKELFAEAIHYSSNRKDAPLITINCGAIPPSLFESELFGYEGGAFTGADRKGKPGQFEIANGGTIFLDEVGELPLEMQVKLLRVLQNKMFYRVGGTKPIKVDIRIISATNCALEEMIEQGKFRSDLFYRLDVVSVKIPPLRERREDIPEIVQFFLGEFSKKHNRDINKVNRNVISRLLAYSWPGNIRELRNVLERMVILTENGEIDGEFLPAILMPKNGENDTKTGFFDNITEQTERDLILNALESTGYNITHATVLLGIPRSTLYNKMKILGIKNTP